METDYDGSYGYMITDKSVRNGNDLQLGFASAPTDQITNQSATMTKALRQASKNILYTIVNSGYYVDAESDPSEAPDKMVTTFRNADIGIAVVLIALEALFIALWMKKKKTAVTA